MQYHSSRSDHQPTRAPIENQPHHPLPPSGKANDISNITPQPQQQHRLYPHQRQSFSNFLPHAHHPHHPPQEYESQVQTGRRNAALANQITKSEGERRKKRIEKLQQKKRRKKTIINHNRESSHKKIQTPNGGILSPHQINSTMHCSMRSCVTSPARQACSSWSSSWASKAGFVPLPHPLHRPRPTSCHPTPQGTHGSSSASNQRTSPTPPTKTRLTQDLTPPINPREYPFANSVCGLWGLESGSRCCQLGFNFPFSGDARVSLEPELVPNWYGVLGLGDGAQ